MENSGKVLFSTFYVSPNGEEQHDVVINKIEADHLPLTPFLDEWAILSEGDGSKGKMAKVKAGLRQLGNVERVVPVVFGLLYLMLLIGRLALCPTT